VTLQVDDGALLRALFEAPVLRALDVRGRQEIQAAMKIVRLSIGEALYAHGDRGDSFFVTLSGSVRIAVAKGRGSDRVVLRDAKAGDSFGEEATVIGRRQADAAALDHAVVAEIPVHLFRRAAVRSGQGDLAEKLVRTLERSAARDVLAGTPLGQNLDEAGLDAVLDAVTFHTFARGQVVYRQGDASTSLFVVGDGLIQIQTDDDDRVRVRAYVARGDFFGDEEIELATPRAASAVANGPSTVMAVPARVVRALASREPQLFPELRRVSLGLGDKQRGVVGAAAKNATQHVFRDLYRVQVARSLLVIDLESCVRCGQCSWACGAVYGTSRLVRRGDKVVTRAASETPEAAGEFDVFRMRAGDIAGPTSLLLPSSCQHCENPACMVDCPTGAIGKDPTGEVFIREELCTGCGACARACPWTNIQLAPRPKEAARPAGIAADTLAVKCDLCRTYERGPACVQACPTNAILRIDPQEDWSEVGLLLGQRGEKRDAAREREARAPWPAWPIVLGAFVAASSLGLVGWLMVSRGQAAPSRGTGYAAGWAAGATMLALLAYALPKRAIASWMKLGGRRDPSRKEGELPTDRMRRSKSATRPHYIAHLALGLLLLGFALAHAPSPFAPRATSGGALTIALFIAGLSGIALGVAYAALPKRLSRIERTPLLPEDFAKEKDALSTRLFKSLSGRDPLLKAVADKVLLPYARNPFGPVMLLASGRELRLEQRVLRSRIDDTLEGRGHDRLGGIDELVRTAVELRALPAQRMLTLVLRTLLPIHVVSFMMAIGLLVLHVVNVLGAR
jgi:Fe-S-cluster-containing dehydrogenase component/CRP-like cAMP-binding protein